MGLLACEVPISRPNLFGFGESVETSNFIHTSAKPLNSSKTL